MLRQAQLHRHPEPVEGWIAKAVLLSMTLLMRYLVAQIIEE